MRQEGSRHVVWYWGFVGFLLLLSGCGGGGGGGNGGGGTGGPPQGPQPTVTLTLGTPAVQPGVIPPSTDATQITFLSLINGSATPPVLLLDEVDSEGNVLADGVAQLRDDGALADAERGDRMYTGTLMVNNPTATAKYYRVRTEHNGATLTSGIVPLWISGCPTTARPSDPAQLVPDSRSTSLIFANEVMVRPAAGVAPDVDHINSISAAVHGQVVGCIPALNQYLVEIDGDGSAAGVYDAIDTLVAHADIAAAFPNVQTLAPPPSPTQSSLLCDGVVDSQCQWYLDRVRAPQAWALAGGGDPQRSVAVIDFGVDCSRGDLDCDSTLYNEDPIDHGTGVAGLIGAGRNPTGMVGVAWNTRLHPYSFLGRAGSQYKLNELITASLGQADVRVINVSAGTRSDVDGQIKDALCGAIDSGRLVVAAAGNPAGGSCEQTDIYPAAYNTAADLCDSGTPLQSGLLVVGATDIDNRLAQWDDANHQPQCSNQQYVDVYAPGKDIVTLSTEHGYSLKSGTSYAAALVSGAASVMWTVDPGDTPQQIQDRLLNRAALLTDVETTSPLYTEDVRVAGERFLDLYRAVGGQDAIVTPDTMPDDYAIASQSNAPLQTYIVSEPVTITGIDSPTPIRIDGGYYSLDNNTFTSAGGVIENNQQVWVQLRSADTSNTSRDATLTIGGVSQVYRVTTREAITTPGDFQFLEQTGVPRNTLIASNSQTITGIDANTPISISNGEYAINGGAFTTAAGTLNTNDSVQVRLTSSADYASLTKATLTIGDLSRNFTVVTALADTTPDAFGFTAQTAVPRNSTQTSNTVTITGLTAPAIISISGGEYAIDGGAFTATTATIRNNQTVQLRQIAAVSYGATTSATLTIGGITGRFDITTPAADTIPDDFSFTAQTNVPVNTPVTSNTITVTGINTATPISISGGDYAIDGGAFTNAAGTINNNQTVQVRVTSAATQAIAVNAILTIGGLSRLFTVSTAGADTTPDAFSFIAQTGAPLSTPITSNTVTITGINTDTPISIANGDYAIDGGPFTNAAGTITNNQTVQVRVASSDQPDAITSATLNVGDVTTGFDVTTVPADTTPDPFDNFTPQTDVPLNSTITSNSVIISGINTSAPISISGGRYSINGAAFTNSAGTITNGQAVQVRLTSASQPDITTTATLTIDGVNANFDVTTVPADTTPDAFTFTAQTDVAISSLITSNTVTITGINTAAPISITNGDYAIDGGSFTNAAGTIANNQTVQVRQTSSGQPGATTTATVTVGGANVDFNVTTIPEYQVTARSGLNGSISPSYSMVLQGDTVSFTVAPNTGYTIDGVTGCGGSLVDDIFTTGPITADCTVSANFSVFGDIWTTVTAPTTHRDQHTTTLLSNGKVLVVGGNQTSAVEVYDPITNSWSAAASLSVPRAEHTATLLPNGKVLVVGGYNLGVSYASAELYDPVTDTWSSAGNLTTGRYYHSATLLSNGKVLVAGGLNRNGGLDTILSSVELYDPKSNSWSTTASLSIGRQQHAAVPLPDGKLMVIGGLMSGGTRLASAEIYNPVTNAWSASASMATARNQHTATMLPNGHVLVAGGYGAAGVLGSVELYDPESDIWSTAANLLIARRQHSATMLGNGKVLVLGGVDATSGYLDSAELYDPTTNAWANASTPATTRAFHTATVLGSGNVLVVGGYSSVGTGADPHAELYIPLIDEPPPNEWVNAAEAARRFNHTATLLNNGKVLIAAGFYGGLNLATAELYDYVTDSWTSVGNLIDARREHTATLLRDGRVLVVGGFGNAGELSSAEIFNPLTSSWSSAGALTSIRYRHTATLLPDGTVLVVGGGTGLPGTYFASAEIYDPLTNAWSPAASLATGRSGHSATLLPSGKVLVAGGEGASGTLDSAELYDPVANAWIAAGSLAHARSSQNAVLLPNGKVLVVGGYAYGGFAESELYDYVTNTWSVAASLATRISPSMTLLHNGVPLLMGTMLGDQGSNLYDPITDTWITGGSVAINHDRNTLTLLPNGKLLIVGDDSVILPQYSTAETYSSFSMPANGSFR